MKILFAGTPEFAVPTLAMLLASKHEVVGVYTQPDRPAGRGRKEKPGPVKALAEAHGLATRQPTSLKSPEAQEELRAFGADLMVVVAYGLILPKTVLEIPKLGCINVHGSLLPRWRGAAPIQRAIYAGDAETGVTIMFMEPTLDTGPMLLKAATPIGALETSAELYERLALLGAQALADCLPAIESGTIQPEIQDDTQATLAKKLDKAEAIIDWTLPALEIERRVRAFNPWPVAETSYEGAVLRIWRAQALEGQPDGEPGAILPNPKSLDVVTGAGILRLLEVQLPGGKRLSATDFLNGRSVKNLRLGGGA